MSRPLPTYFLSHGGGPWPWLKAEMPGVFDKLERSLQAIPAQLSEIPKAILVISGHWIERETVISGHPNPEMIYDFSGFPEHTYHVQYKAPGSPSLAERIDSLLNATGISSRIDRRRGFDHGTYTLLVPMFPNANIPVVQLSLQRRFDPESHLQLGRALAPLRREGVLIIGSGLSYHNLNSFGAEAIAPSQIFDRWLQATLTAEPSARWQGLIDWSSAPSARQAHPREDHLLPLMVAVGAAEDEAAHLIYHEDTFMGSWCVSSFRFGNKAEK